MIVAPPLNHRVSRDNNRLLAFAMLLLYGI
jgi:hypothetical protein